MTTNVAEMAVVLLGLAGVAVGNWAIPILAIQILSIDLLAEVLPLTFLTFDPPADNIMQMPPRDRNSHIMDLSGLLEVLFLGAFIGVLAFVNFGLFMYREGVLISPDMMNSPLFARATAITFLTIAFCQFVNILSRRHEYTSIFNANIATNRILLGSIALSIVMVLIGTSVSFISDFLSFSSPGLVDWFHILGAAVSFLALFEAVKLFRRIKRSRETKPGKPAGSVASASAE
jgi:Ca2+-transporting ATPase